MDALTCLQANDECAGEVELRTPLSGTGVPFPRCDHHWSLRLEQRERDLERDADAQRVDWFDAGEVYEDAF